MKKKIISMITVVSLLIVTTTFLLAGCVEGNVLLTQDIFKEVSVAYWEPIDESGEIDVDKPVIGSEDITSVVGNEHMPMRMYSYIGLKWNHSNSDKHEYTVITFAVTCDQDIEFQISIMGGNIASGDVLSTHVVKCKENVPVGVALALNGMRSTGAMSERVSFVNLFPEQRKVNWRISDVQIGGKPIEK